MLDGLEPVQLSQHNLDVLKVDLELLEQVVHCHELCVLLQLSFGRL